MKTRKLKSLGLFSPYRQGHCRGSPSDLQPTDPTGGRPWNASLYSFWLGRHQKSLRVQSLCFLIAAEAVYLYKLQLSTWLRLWVYIYPLLTRFALWWECCTVSSASLGGETSHQAPVCYCPSRRLRTWHGPAPKLALPVSTSCRRSGTKLRPLFPSLCSSAVKVCCFGFFLLGFAAGVPC